MDIHCYSPRPQSDYRSAYENISIFKHESWNLLFLTVNMDKRYPYSDAVGLVTAIQRTVACDFRTGEQVNPLTEPHRQLVAGLLRGSPHHFYAWALNNPVFEQLPITLERPDWLKSAKRRLPRCAPHPDDAHFMLDEGVTDLRMARVLLGKLARPQRGHIKP